MAAVTIPPTVVGATASRPLSEQVDPILLAKEAAHRLAEAMELVSPGGKWDVIVNHENRCAIVVDKVRPREDWV